MSIFGNPYFEVSQLKVENCYKFHGKLLQDNIPEFSKTFPYQIFLIDEYNQIAGTKYPTCNEIVQVAKIDFNKQDRTWKAYIRLRWHKKDKLYLLNEETIDRSINVSCDEVLKMFESE